jgi:ABC-type branched-subunit amino acid transport system permease subunit
VATVSRLHLAVLLALALVPLVAADWQLVQLGQLLCYGLLALSLALIWGQGGLLCFGQSLFFGLGGYVMGLASLDMLPGVTGLGAGWTALLLACLVPALAAQLLGRFLFHGRGLRGAYFAVVMLAISVIAERVATSWDYVGGLNGLMNVPPFAPCPGVVLLDPRPTYWAMVGVAALAFVLAEALVRSRWGIVLRAIRDGEDRVALLGHDTAAWKTTALTVSAAIAGLGGACFVVQFGFVSPPLIGFGLSTEALIWTALGGRGLLIAALLGALVGRWLEGVLFETLGALWLLAIGALFVGVVIWLPRGLIAEPLLRWAGRGGLR